MPVPKLLRMVAAWLLQLRGVLITLVVVITTIIEISNISSHLAILFDHLVHI